MRRNARSITTSPDIVRHIDGLTEANFNLLTGLIEWLAENDKRQRKFMNCVLRRLSKIETVLNHVQACQLLKFWTVGHGYGEVSEERRDELLQAASNRCDAESEQLGLKMIRYIYGDEPTPEPHFDRRRKWWGWEI